MKCMKSSLYVFIVSFIFMLMFIPCSSSADPLDNWHWRNPLPKGNILLTVTYGNNTFVAVGEYHRRKEYHRRNKTILTSPDGVIWTKRSSGTTNRLCGVTYGNNTFVAVGSAGTILTSPDGIIWTIRTSGTTNWLEGVTYENNTFVAVGWNGTILQSDPFQPILVSPTSHNFGSINVGSSSAPQTFTISSTGTADLNISGMSLSDTTNYTLDVNGGTNPCGNTTPTITPDGNCSVAITFNPLSTGQKDASLTVNSDDPDAQTLNVSLSGTGTVQQDTTPPSLSITSHSNNQHVAALNITLAGTASDSGRGDNGIQQVTVNGSRADNDTATGSGTANWTKVVNVNAGANTITVIAYDDSTSHNQTSQTITIYYDVPDTTAPTTTTSPSGGTYTSAQNVTLTCNDGSGSGCQTTYYCLDSGCNPITVYSSPINISSSTDLRFYSTDNANNSETVKTETYTINISPTTVTCSLTPSGATQLSRGSNLNFLAAAQNNTDQVQVFQFASKVTLPNGTMYPPSGYLVGPIDVTLTPGQSKSKQLSQVIPLNAPFGTYTYRGYVGTVSPPLLYNQCQFTFSVNP